MNYNDTIRMTDEQIDKLITHIESMIDSCDTPEEIEFYETWLSSVLTQANER